MAEEDRIAQVRAFNRFYTRVIGVLGEGLAGTSYSLVEARVLYELAADPESETEVIDIRRALDLDAGYLSRILARFEADGLVGRAPSPSDARRQVIRLTQAGRLAYRELDRHQVAAVRELLAPLSAERQASLVESMAAIRRALGAAPAPRGFVLRPPEPGELGWVVTRHGALYASEYGWDVSFEALVARLVADYAEQHDPAREAAWIAEVDGEPTGSVFCVAAKDDAAHTAQLRMLLVEPSARGLGIGARLVEECLRFARRTGYTRITLWTNSVLGSARRIYQSAGFTLDHEAPHHSFGHDLIEQTWSRPL